MIGDISIFIHAAIITAFFYWNGKIEIKGGNLLKLRKLDYPVVWYGPGHCAEESSLPGNSWQNSTKMRSFRNQN